VAGLELPVKLRRGLGQGNIVPADELAKRIEAFDADADGAITRAELAQFLAKNHVGGPWFCEVVAKTLWKYVEQRMGTPHATLACDRLGRIIHVAMSRGPRPERRYEITPEGMAGYEPLKPIKRPGEKGEGFAQPRTVPLTARPSAGDRMTPPTRAASTQPGRAGAATAGPVTRAPAAGRSRPIPRRPGPRR
jgi:hypothetical protein